MVFSSVPSVYRDPWHHHHLHQQPNLGQETISTGNAELPPPPQYGGGRKAGSMTERAKVAKIPQPETALKCPRCESTNTKFCYFNNYNLSQPRHLCKTCRRYWTRGGVLRNVPVGGGCRRNKKSTSKKTTSSSKPHGTGTHVKHSIIDSTTCSSMIAPHQLPLLSSLQNLGQFGGLNVTHDSVLSADQWRSMHNNFPILAGGFDQSSPAAAINSNLVFSFQNDIGVNEATPRSRVSGALKMEESQLGLLRRSSATPFWGNNNNQCYTNSWGGGEWLGNTAPGQQLHSSGGGGGGGGTTTHFL